MPIRDVRVKSLGALIDAVTPAEPDAHTGRWRDMGIYRGSSDADEALLTSLDRLGGVSPPHGKVDLETHILRNFSRHARPYFPNPPSEWELLFAAQHHGVPTRLLDWSYSPLVAAHFATVDGEAQRNRVVWRLDWRQVHRHFKLPELALLIQDLDQHFGQGKAFSPWAFFESDLSDTPFACMLEPPALDKRIVAQSAVFTLCTDTFRAFDAFLDAHALTSALTRFVIPAADAARIRDQLDMVAVDERHLFPHLDGVAAELRRYYA